MDFNDFILLTEYSEEPDSHTPSEMSVILEDMLNLREDFHQDQDEVCIVCDKT